jgi:hypothetical protein
VAAIPLVMLAGAAVSAIGAMSQANAAKAAHSYNATLRERDAIVATEQSGQDALRVQRHAAMEQGNILAGYGASGVATDEGSPLDVLRMSAANAKLDEGTVLYKGRLKATGYATDATLERRAGRTAEEQGYLNSASYALTGIGRAGATYEAGRRPLNRGSSYSGSDILYED